MSTSPRKRATGTSPASSAQMPGLRGATHPSQTDHSKLFTRFQRKTQRAGAGDKPRTMAGSKGGASLPVQGNPDELRDAAIEALQWAPVEGVVYQMNLHPDTPPWYDFTIFARGSMICLLPSGDWSGLGLMHASVVSRDEWFTKMQTRRFRRKPIAA